MITESTNPARQQQVIAPPWVSGLRPKVKGRDWREAVASIILNEMERLPVGEKTAEAEAGLGLKSSLYWYILRAEELFGYAVFLWRANVSDWLPDQGGMSPFDSGGLWHDYIQTTSPLVDDEAKRVLFAQNSRGLRGWNDVFRSYLSDNYDNPQDYILGLPPRFGVPQILKQSPNSAQAWTWEARVAREAFNAGLVALQTLYWRQNQEDSFLLWIEGASRYDDLIQERLTLWVQAHGVICPVSESPTQQAVRDLMRFLRS